MNSPIFALSSISAAFVAVLVGMASSVVIVLHAAAKLGATPAQSASWLWALGVGIALLSIGLSLRYRIPVATAWSMPSAAMLITSDAGFSLSDATGAFLISALLVTIVGFSGVFARVMGRIPLALSSALLVGVLLRFGLDVFTSLQTDPYPVLAMLVSYLLMKRTSSSNLPRYAMVASLCAGLLCTALMGHFNPINWPLDLSLTTPQWVTPSFSWKALLGLAIPLFIVTMTSQNIPGIAALRSAGYEPPISSIIGWSGIVTFVLAPFGGFSLNLAAITAAICVSHEAHHNPAKRWGATVMLGFMYLIIGLFASAVVVIVALFPHVLILSIAGIALFSTIANGLAQSLADPHTREPALITFLVSASNFSAWGIGAAFWGLIAGTIVLFLLPRKAQ